jgi:hypothetical protein
MNIKLIDERIKTAAKMLSQYDPKDIMILSRREMAGEESRCSKDLPVREHLQEDISGNIN